MVSLTALSTGLEGLNAKESAAKPESFLVFQPKEGFQLPEIVLQYDPATKSGANWAEIKNAANSTWNPPAQVPQETLNLGYAANYLQDGLRRMTGKDFPITSQNDLSRGIVLTLFKNASADVRNDPEVRKALKTDPNDPYASSEAFFIRSEKNRTLVVANTGDGMTDAVSELLESVDYEVLGMGQDWIYSPDHRNTPLVFSLKRADRASFYIRNLCPICGQHYGIGTVMTGLTDPADETVPVSYLRWGIGTRLYGVSMPPFPGHALQAYHEAIIKKMSQLAMTEGFLARVKAGPEAQRPKADPTVKGLIWLNTDERKIPEIQTFAYCDGKDWQPCEEDSFGDVDLSSSLAREVIFEGMKKFAEASFAARPDDPVIFPMDAEDGETGGAERDQTMAHKNWYPEYLAKEKLPFGRPYVLNGFMGLNQPREIWDPTSCSDTIYGFATYLLHEYDKWIDSLPKDQRITSTGKSKKALIRCSLQSYNYHDVPPDFNIDKRIRVSIAPFPKNRGIGKWEKIATPEDMAKALRVMLPNSPSANYSFYSFSLYRDGGPEGIPPGWSDSASDVADAYRHYYEAGFRSIGYEIDFNFGKNGLLYYLASKMLWNANLTAKDLDTIRNRWFQRSFGSAWKEMKAYYDFLLPEIYPVNGPRSWAKAIRLLDVADKKINGTKEPEAQRRIDDVKQYWYAHYLMDTGEYTVSSPEVKEFLWKGQMSYITGMQGLLARDFKSSDVRAVVGPQISSGPAHYTHLETQAWWAKVVNLWPLPPTTLFSDAILADGTPARDLDLNDLVMVKEFQTSPTDSAFLYNSVSMRPETFFMVAEKKDDLLGFKLSWPFNPDDPNYAAKKVSYGADIWDPARKVWKTWLDQTTTFQQSVEIVEQGQKYQLADASLKAPRAGVYRFALGRGGDLARLGSPAYDPIANQYAHPMGFTYSTEGEGLTQGGVYFYIPKGTKCLDLDVWDTRKVKFVTLHKGLPNGKMTASRRLDIGAIGAHTITLQPGEDGSLALVESDLFDFPFLYSVPKLWAGSPASLLVPRGIAVADGLTVMNSPENAQAGDKGIQDPRKP